ncbi:unnamed protein product [Nesidiocoris tenuis]|uniref:Uncharacterized protein n=1 Tax=Nesidiocoris tenuis TaxID=355587 RepID=A0A6H5HIS0_9HEMI|nr:unnamed protein product [Nesidiocoris tenuis]
MERGPPWRPCDHWDELYAQIPELVRQEQNNPSLVIKHIQDIAQVLYANENPNPQPYVQKLIKPPEGAFARIHQPTFPLISAPTVQEIIDEGLAKNNIKERTCLLLMNLVLLRHYYHLPLLFVGNSALGLYSSRTRAFRSSVGESESGSESGFDEAEGHYGISTDATEEVSKGSLERVTDRSYVRDWVRLGLVHSSPASPNSLAHKEQFRVSNVNSGYLLCRTSGVKMNLTRGRWGSVKDSEGRMLRPSGDSDSGSDCVHTLHFAPLYILSDKTHYKVLRPQSNLAVLDVWNYYVSEDLRHGPSYDLELIQLEACQQEETDAAEGTQSPARQVVMNGVYIWTVLRVREVWTAGRLFHGAVLPLAVKDPSGPQLQSQVP